MKKILLFLAISGFGKISGQDRVFTFTYQSGVLNKAQKEIEVATTIATGRENFYRGLEHRMEYEIGLGSKLQTSFYLNYAYSKGVEDNNGTQSVNSETEYSFSNEWKLKLSDPIADRIGSALYFEYTIAPSEIGFEGKLIFDKQYNKLVNAFNMVGEYIISKNFTTNGSKIDIKNEGLLNLELNYGLAYSIKNNLNIGIEAFNQNQVITSKWENSVLFLGPCFSYSTDGFWINLTCMPQISNLKGSGLELKDHERIQTRLIFSYAF